MNEDIIARLDGVTLTYHEPARETKAIEGLSLSVRRGEFLSIVGPSGCGKTSVLKLLTGLYEPSSGSVSVLGARPREALKKVGYMLQRDELLDWRTIEKNGRGAHGKIRARRIPPSLPLGAFRRHEAEGGAHTHSRLFAGAAAA